jgi:hypothetical protein
MIIDDFIRNEENQVVAICGDEQVILTAEYISEFKPQIGDMILMNQPAVKEETPVETEATETEEK